MGFKLCLNCVHSHIFSASWSEMEQAGNELEIIPPLSSVIQSAFPREVLPLTWGLEGVSHNHSLLQTPKKLPMEKSALFLWIGRSADSNLSLPPLVSIPSSLSPSFSPSFSPSLFHLVLFGPLGSWAGSQCLWYLCLYLKRFSRKRQEPREEILGPI